MSQMDEELKAVCNDSIHGHIELNELCREIVDTPQFQRLRYLKQLGATYMVYPGASHNRFEHSLGVCHLAGKFVRALQQQQPKLNITKKDILCVEIAGLCHDLGHGPLSHAFDGMFIPRVKKGRKWKHEDASVDMLKYLIKENHLEERFKEKDLEEEDITFITELIAGKKLAENDSKLSERRKDKSFLYQIVANKKNGIDVDKFDYFARDCHMLGIKNNFDHLRYMALARVIKVDGELEICVRDKEVANVYDMFYIRNTLHRRAYQHKTAKIIEEMITEAMEMADKHILFPGRAEKGQKVELKKLSDTIDDMEAYSYVTDYVFYQILLSPAADPKIQEAKAILKRVQNRELYKFLGESRPKSSKKEELDKEHCLEYEKEIAKTEVAQQLKPLKPEDLLVRVIDFNYGMKKENPIKHVRFYKKSKPDEAFEIEKEEVSKMLPEAFEEQVLRVYCKKTDEASLNLAASCFKKWCEENDMYLPK